MSANPRRTLATRPDSSVLSMKTNIGLKKGSTFHSPLTPPSSPEPNTFRPPTLARRPQSNLDDVIDSHRRRTALTLSRLEKALSQESMSPPLSPKLSHDEILPPPRGLLSRTLDTSIMGKEPEVERRVLRPRIRRAGGRHHESDSGLGTSLASTQQKQEKRAATAPTQQKQEKRVEVSTKNDRETVKPWTVARSGVLRSYTRDFTRLSTRATNRIYEHTLKPLLAKPAFKDFHPLVLECPRKIQEKEIVCLRDVEKTLILLAPEKTKDADLYLDFCLTTIRCIQATVEYLSDREQTCPRDLPYTGGYFIDLVDQLHHYAQQLADAKEKKEGDGMDVDSTDEIKLHGGIHVNGRPAELVRVKKDGKVISLATGLPIDALDEKPRDGVKVKRSPSEELADEEEIMRSMARRRKNASPEELAPKRCREPGCTKEFRRPCDLTKHEKTHSRPWKCPVPTCKYHEYGWPTEKEMDRHHNDKHSAAPPMFECLYKPCPYRSKRESNCKQHMEKAHGWNYVRTKTNGKPQADSSTHSGSTQATPQLQNMPTPSSDGSISIATPPDDFGRFYGHNIEFPTLSSNGPEFNPPELELDFSPVPLSHRTPSTDSGMDPNPAYQDFATDITLNEDIYGAFAQLATPMPANVFHPKQMPPQFAAYDDASFGQPPPAQLSPHAQASAMLFTPTSLIEGDDCFDEHAAYTGLGNGVPNGDFVLFPNNAVSKPMMQVSKPMMHDALFAAELPSLAAGYSQPSSQDFLPPPVNPSASFSWAGYDFDSQYHV